MNYPKHSDTPETWLAWVDKYAPLGGTADPELHPDLRFLCGIGDRALAALSAKGAVTVLRERRQLEAVPEVVGAQRYEQQGLYR